MDNGLTREQAGLRGVHPTGVLCGVAHGVLRLAGDQGRLRLPARVTLLPTRQSGGTGQVNELDPPTPANNQLVKQSSAALANLRCISTAGESVITQQSCRCSTFVSRRVALNCADGGVLTLCPPRRFSISCPLLEWCVSRMQATGRLGAIRPRDTRAPPDAADT
jgi:hypothetical protein